MEDPNVGSNNDAVSFSNFPEDVQLSILSFLASPEISSFACTSKHFVSLCSDDAKLWLSMCLRRWGAHTNIQKWGSPSSGKITYRRLYQTLSTWENLIGFWRQGGPQVNSPPLIFFEWCPSYLAGSRVCPAKDGESYGVVKSPFLWMSVTAEGEPECRAEMGPDLVAVSVSVMGKTHFVVEEEMATSRKAGSSAAMSIERGVEAATMIGYESGSPGSSPGSPSEIYQYFANRTSPGGERATRRQRRREREKQMRRKLESLHFVKIVDCEPTPTRPLQGLWKGMYDDMNLGFYLVAYDDIGGVSCQKVCDSSGRCCSSSRGIRPHPVFWATDTTFSESPFLPDEENYYNCRIHLQPNTSAADHIDQHGGIDAVSRILWIDLNYDLTVPYMIRTSTNTVLPAQGRVWQYKDGTFGFGSLQDSFIRDLKHVTKDGFLLDIM